MTTKNGCLGGGGNKAVGEAEEEGKCGGRRRYKENDGMQTEGSNQLLPAARRKGHWEMVGKEDWTDRGECVRKMWGGRADSVD